MGSSLAPTQLHNLSATSDNPLQAICPKLKSFPLLLLVGVVNVNAKRHPRLGRGAMVGDMAQDERRNAKLRHTC